MVHPKEYGIEQLIATEIAPWIAGPSHGLWIQVASRFTIVVRSRSGAHSCVPPATGVLHARARPVTSIGVVHAPGRHSCERLPKVDTAWRTISEQPPNQYGLSMSDKNFVNKIPPSVRRKVVRQYYHDEAEIETTIAWTNRA
jgi:hypothetical protein